MNHIALISFIIIGSIITISAIFKLKYDEYDEKETKKENLDDLNSKIRDILDYFREKYSDDNTVYNNIKIKVDFITKLISKNENIDKKMEYTELLFKMLYETEIRLKTNYDNVSYVTAPLNTVRDKVVEEHLNYIRENSDI